MIQEQIKNRIANYKQTISGIDQEGKTEWHKKQINSLQEKINELEWVLKNINFDEDVDADCTEFEKQWLVALGENVFVKNDTNSYFYISENKSHGVRLEYLLKQFKQYLVALSKVTLKNK